MAHSLHNRLVIGLIIAASAAFLLSCVAGMIEPKKGVTGQFFQELGDKTVNLATYDFTRLQKGYGLCVFSFDYRGEKGSRIIGYRDQQRTGLRVWECKFDPESWDVKWVDKKMLVWGFPDATFLFLKKSGYRIGLRVPFHRGRIVYGGRVMVDWDTYLSSGPSMEFHFDEDMRSWLDQFGQRIEGIKIDTELIVAHY